MKKIQLSKQKAILVHPNDTDIQFHVTRPRVEEAVEFNDGLGMYRRVQVALHPETNEPIRDAKGKLETIDLPPIYPPDVLTNYLVKFIDKILGVSDDQDETLDKKEHVVIILPRLFEREFACTLPDGLDKEGNPKTKTVSCPDWLVQEIHKPENYSGPFGQNSSRRSKDDLGNLETTVESVS